jgi:hypothetical protein
LQLNKSFENKKGEEYEKPFAAIPDGLGSHIENRG